MDSALPPLRVMTGQRLAISRAAFSADGKILVTGSWEHTVALWDVATGHQRHSVFAHLGRVYGVAFSPDGEAVTSCGSDGTVKLWKADRGARTVSTSGTSLYQAVFSPDGKAIAWGGKSGTVALSDLVNRRYGAHFLCKHSEPVWGLAFSPDGKILASGSADKSIKLFDVITRRRCNILKYLIDKLTKHSDFACKFHPFFDKVTDVCENTPQRELRTLEGHLDRVGCIAFSPDGKTLASGSDDKTIKLWNVRTGRLLHTLSGHLEAVTHLSFSPDGQIITSGSTSGSFSKNQDDAIRQWSVATGQELRRIRRRGQTAAFSPDGRTVASHTGNDTLTLWDMVTGREVILIGESNVFLKRDSAYEAK